MKVEALDIPDAWVCTPNVFGDDRGVFLEWFRADALAEQTGRRFTVAQANHSVSRRGSVRGVHYADVPPGQAKYVYCPRGAVLDVIVDIRVGSPTFGRSTSVVLDETDRRGVFLSEGLGHAFCALADETAVTYLVSSVYNPTAEHGVHPLDVDLALPWPGDADIVLSPKDAAAPTLAAARDAGMLPPYDDCRRHYDSLTA
ncbi:MAG TPA: dTDP-4-dehydrorhamnose 3,5-epimerase family protein [Mycobacteriales bacterium]|nr:dTDP-4-dehydrorhamnose 3,5-epimerase family protein [Mycobacteriales bacterium]